MEVCEQKKHILDQLLAIVLTMRSLSREIEEFEGEYVKLLQTEDQKLDRESAQRQFYMDYDEVVKQATGSK